MNYGWICPRCNRVYSPNVSSCIQCNLRSRNTPIPGLNPGVPLPDTTFPDNWPDRVYGPGPRTFPNDRIWMSSIHIQ